MAYQVATWNIQSKLANIFLAARYMRRLSDPNTFSLEAIALQEIGAVNRTENPTEYPRIESVDNQAHALVETQLTQTYAQETGHGGVWAALQYRVILDEQHEGYWLTYIYGTDLDRRSFGVGFLTRNRPENQTFIFAPDYIDPPGLPDSELHLLPDMQANLDAEGNVFYIRPAFVVTIRTRDGNLLTLASIHAGNQNGAFALDYLRTIGRQLWRQNYPRQTWQIIALGDYNQNLRNDRIYERLNNAGYHLTAPIQVTRPATGTIIDYAFEITWDLPDALDGPQLLTVRAVVHLMQDHGQPASDHEMVVLTLALREQNDHYMLPGIRFNLQRVRILYAGQPIAMLRPRINHLNPIGCQADGEADLKKRETAAFSHDDYLETEFWITPYKSLPDTTNEHNKRYHKMLTFDHGFRINLDSDPARGDCAVPNHGVEQNMLIFHKHDAGKDQCWQFIPMYRDAEFYYLIKNEDKGFLSMSLGRTLDDVAYTLATTEELTLEQDGSYPAQFRFTIEPVSGDDS